ncbi:MAG: DEAD/DEAH box helicase family protein [Nanoarchaeota archaeon]|nr:DEAD/DEAH box helicase family protein [Nanoarchaeota archaeon]
MVQKEAKARIKINKLLEVSGWRFFDSKDEKANIKLEANVKIEELGDDFEKTKNGFIDFLLLGKNKKPLAVLEAKSEDKHPLSAKEQARRYANSENARFVILSNGNIHYLWDLKTGDPNQVTSFPTEEDLNHKNKFTPNPEAIVKEKIETDYIVLTQKPDYNNDPKYLDDEKQVSYIKENQLKFLRPYQINAVTHLQEAVKNKKNRFLFEMATGTGKTLVSAAICKLFLRTENVNRILFLVDRIELENQAWKNLNLMLKNDFIVKIYKENKDDWMKADIVISTVQSLMVSDKYKEIFSPTDFDLIISDEAHRSIGGNSRAVFEYFVGYKLGLTATPKDYIKNLDDKDIFNMDPRKWELRQLRDTYKTFGCETGDPTFRYSLLEGVKDGYLVNPLAVDARTDITTELLAEKGYAIVTENEEGKKEEKVYIHKDFEKKFFSEETNETFCRTFIENAQRDPITEEIGKTIIFCVSQDHAAKITNMLNKLATKLFPEKYTSDFAIQITSLVDSAQQMAMNFANNNLNGHTKFKEDYNSSKTRVCVTVGMMTTGYDCEDLLNICLMRPIFSPTDFVQIKGRGTRTFKFSFKKKNELGEIEEDIKSKNTFKLFDFFGNCEYFEKKFNYGQFLKLPPMSSKKKNEVDVMIVRDKEYENYNQDPLKQYLESKIGIEGMKIDRKLFESFSEKIRKNTFIVSKVNEREYEEAEEYIKNNILDKPKEFYTLDKLRKALKLNRRLSLREILEYIFGKIKQLKNKDELMEDEIQKFVITNKINENEIKYYYLIKEFFKAYLTDKELQEIMETKEYQRLATNPIFNMKEFKELKEWNGGPEFIVNYIKDYVPINKFLQC